MSRNREQERAAYQGLSTRRMAAQAGCSTEHIVNLIHAGKLPAINIGTGERPLYRVDRLAWEDYLAQAVVRPDAA